MDLEADGAAFLPHCHFLPPPLAAVARAESPTSSSVAAPSFGLVESRPSSFRRSRSILRAFSGFFFRTTLALSPPCPMHSLSKESQEPLFSTILLAAAKSSRSPSRDIPCP